MLESIILFFRGLFFDLTDAGNKDETVKYFIRNRRKKFSMKEIENKKLVFDSELTTNDPYESHGPGKYYSFKKNKVYYIFKEIRENTLKPCFVADAH